MMSPGFAHDYTSEGLSVREPDGAKLYMCVKSEHDPSLEVRTSATPLHVYCITPRASPGVL
jgi:hypothetical protein